MAFRYFKGMKIPIPGVDTAVKVLRPNARYDCTVQSGVYDWAAWECDDGTSPPTQEEIEEELKRECIIYNYFLYEVNRQKAYPEIKEQLDIGAFRHAIRFKEQDLIDNRPILKNLL